MSRISRNCFSEKPVAYIILILFFISLLPLLYTAQYLHPVTDDYVFGAEAYHVWNNTHSLVETWKAAWHVAMRMYTDWQGTYTACFLMALQPDVFGLYYITPFLMIIPFVVGNYWLTYLIVCKLLKGGRWQYLIISTTIILMSMQCIPSPVDAFYWYNGALYYTFYYSACLFLACFLIQCIRVSSLCWKSVYGTLAGAACLFIAGGNYVTGLAVPVMLSSSIFVWKIMKKKVPFILYFTLILYLIAFAVSIVAPGNIVRGEHEHSVSALHAIAISFTNGCHFIVKSTNPTTIALFVFLSPLLYVLTAVSKLKFPYAGWVLLGSYCIYCSLFTPTCYALGFSGYARNFNLYFYSYVWFVLFNLFYLLGAIRQKAQAGSPISRDLTSLARHLKVACMPYSNYFYVVLLVLFSVTIVQSQASSKRVFRDLTSGRAQAYHQAMEERLIQYRSDTADIVVAAVERIPVSILAFDVTTDKGHWINQGVALYYGKHSVMVDDTDLSKKEKEQLRVNYRKEVGPGDMVYQETNLPVDTLLYYGGKQ